MYTWSTKIHVVEKNMLEIITPVAWAVFLIYAVWYFASAKHYAPLSLQETKTLWKMHRQDAQCESRKWREIRRRGEIIGFECGCGYKHVQKKPIV